MVSSIARRKVSSDGALQADAEALQAARAAGPFMIATLASGVGYTTALATVAAVFLTSVIGWQVAASRMRPS